MTKAEKLKRQAKLFKALAHPLRLRIVTLLLNNDELSVGEIKSKLKLQSSQPNLSQHLSRLSSVELLIKRRSGKQMLFRVNYDIDVMYETPMHKLEFS